MLSALSIFNVPEPLPVGSLDEALFHFHILFSELEHDGLIVRDFRYANNCNIWVFGYLLDAIKDAPKALKVEKRLFDHERLLVELESHLRTDGKTQSADVVSMRRLTNSLNGLTPVETTDRFAVAHKRRHLNFAWGLLLEMHKKGIYPDADLVDSFRIMYDASIKTGEVATCLMDVPSLIDDIARELTDKGLEGADIVYRYKNWKKY
jgi:hypothetical protein